LFKKVDFAHYLEYSFALFPMCQGGLVVYFLYKVLSAFTLTYLSGLICSIYILPLVMFRVISRLIPLKNGIYPVGTFGINGWIVAFRIQSFLTAFPVFEIILIGVPGLYSIWLRAWGSKIGKGVIWTAQMRLYDRSHLHIGNGVLFGHLVKLSPHLIMRRRESLSVLLKEIKIDDYAVIGGGTYISPGVKIGKYAQVNFGAKIKPNTIIPDYAIFNQNDILDNDKKKM
jgi:acetyltransferase-like isoleucine patch superfamily enzyme